MNEYWRDHPPLHLMIAAFLGIKPKHRRPGSHVNDPAEIAALLGALQQGNPNGR